MTVWRLIAHHTDAETQLRVFRDLGCIAIGWSRVGDLRQIRPASATAITETAKEAYPELDNAHLGGPSLWRFYDELKAGDLVIVGDGSRRRAVMRVTGEYEFISEALAEEVGGYRHRRAAEPVVRDPDDLWMECGACLAEGENIRWTLTRCGLSETFKLAEEIVGHERLHEGALCHVIVNAYERNPVARSRCIAHYGTTCVICGFNFGAVYGPIAEDFIHVHHVKPLSDIGEEYEVDPIMDLRPVCPNCHAVLHLGGRCHTIEVVRQLLQHHGDVNQSEGGRIKAP